MSWFLTLCRPLALLLLPLLLPLTFFCFPRCALLISRVFTLCLNHISVSSVLPTSSLSALRLSWSGAEGEPLHLTHGGSVYNQSKFGLFSHPLNSPIPFPLSSGTQTFTHTTLNLTLPSTATSSFHLVASHACLSIKWWRSKLAGAN